MIKIIHTADFHFSKTSPVPLTTVIDGVPPFPINLRTADAFEKVRKIFKFAVKNKVRYVVISGDVYDTPAPPMWLKSKVARHINYLLSNKIYVIILIGNHDTDGITHTFSDSKELLIDSKYLRIVDEPKVVSFSNGIRFSCLPYIKDGEELKKQLDRLTRLRKEKFTYHNVLVAHFGIDTAIVGSKEIALKAYIEPKDLRGWDYVAMGDYHRNQKVGDAKIQLTNEIWYSGSIQRMDMGERENK